MYNSIHMEVLQRVTDLIDIALNFDFHEPSPALNKIVQTLMDKKFHPYLTHLVVAKLEKDVDVFRVFEYVLKADNTNMTKTSMDLNLRKKLRALSRSLQGGFGNNFRCGDFLRIQVSAFIALGEASFSQKFSSGIPFYDRFSQSVRNFLLDDHILILLPNLNQH